MRNLLLPLVLTAGLTTAAFSQKAFILSQQNKRGFFALSAGGSVPIGHFASWSAVDDRAGVAGRGIALNGSIGYRLLERVGLTIRGEHLRNPVQTDGLIKGLYRNETDTWTASAGDWVVTTFMGGPFVTFPLKRLSLDTRLLAGRAMVKLPGTTMQGNFGAEQMVVRTAGADSQGWAYGGGLTLRYQMGRSLALHVNGDYTHSALTFDNLSSEVQSGADRVQRATFSSDRLISVVSISAGVSVLFGDRQRPF